MGGGCFGDGVVCLVGGGAEVEEVLLRGYVVDDDGGGWSGVFSVPDDGSGKLFGGPKS